MADFKDIVSGTLGTLAGKAKELAESESVRNAVDKLKDSAGSSPVAGIYAQGTERAKAYARIAKLTLELNGQNTELGRVYTEIGRLYFEQNRDHPEGYFAPLFSQADLITEAIHAKEDEINTLKAAVENGKSAPDLDADIADFEQIVNATEADGTQSDFDTRTER